MHIEACSYQPGVDSSGRRYAAGKPGEAWLMGGLPALGTGESQDQDQPEPGEAAQEMYRRAGATRRVAENRYKPLSDKQRGGFGGLFSSYSMTTELSREAGEVRGIGAGDKLLGAS